MAVTLLYPKLRPIQSVAACFSISHSLTSRYFPFGPHSQAEFQVTILRIATNITSNPAFAFISAASESASYPVPIVITNNRANIKYIYSNPTNSYNRPKLKVSLTNANSGLPTLLNTSNSNSSSLPVSFSSLGPAHCFIMDTHPRHSQTHLLRIPHTLHQCPYPHARLIAPSSLQTNIQPSYLPSPLSVNTL